VERRWFDDRSLRHYRRDRLERSFESQGHGEVEPRTGYDQAFVVERGRVDLSVLIPMTGRRMMILMGMLLAVGVRIAMPVLMRKGVQQRHAGRHEIRDKRHRYEQRASVPRPAYRRDAHGREAIPAQEIMSIRTARGATPLTRIPFAKPGSALGEAAVTAPTALSSR
jgi:hypothetical protein